MITPAKPKYMTNKDLLREIHNSKLSYCVYEAPEYGRYDVIVNSLTEVTEELKAAVLAKKQSQLNKAKNGEIAKVEDLVYRLMTHEHIPLDPDRKRKARNTELSHARTNFPPFKHFVIREGAFVEVGRSHWKGDFITGEFCLDQGKMTNALAVMFMMLVERYSKRGNWRGYTYNDEMRSHALLHLSQIGLQFDESKSDNPFAFYTTSTKNCFTRILNLERRNQSIRDDMLIMAGASPSFNRQIENEMEHRAAIDGTVVTPGSTVVLKKKPGRQPGSTKVKD